MADQRRAAEPLTVPEEQRSPGAGAGPAPIGDDEAHANQTLAESSKREEAHPEVAPQTPGAAAEKVKRESGEGSGPVEAAKRVLQEADRTVAGEYEQRDEERQGH